MNLTLHEKIKGAIFGFALGDALGVGTEFMTRSEVEHYYPDGLHHFNEIIRDAHRSQWSKGEPTTDTLMFIATLEELLRTGSLDIYKMAKVLKNVVDSVGEDLNPVFRWVMNTPGWEENPIEVSNAIWTRNHRLEASCDSLQRGILAALISNANTLNDNCRRMVLLTHNDSRCVISALVIAHAAFSLLHHNEMPSYETLEGLAINYEPRLIPYMSNAKSGTLEDLELDDEETFSYTRKAMSAALWAMWHCDNAEDVLYKIVNAGGDADSNAAAATALAGIRYGFDALPEEKYQLKNKGYLEDLAERVTAFIQK